MDDRDRVEILAEILRERMPNVQRIVEEWSVPEADLVSLAQIKDLIWETMAPLGLSILGFSAAERERRQSPADPDLAEASALFARAGEDAGRLLERFLQAADRIRP